uniref:Uncharacterized protein n=1 Tax=Anas zonorhyncha TaxID=75864 RepID=A0A8B9V356_9AVES
RPGGTGAGAERRARSWAAGTLLLLLLLLPGDAGGEVCGSCPGPLRNGSIVARFCASTAGAEPRGRCCLDPGPPRRLLGLDLSNCSLRSLPAAFAEAAPVIVLDLTENPLAALPNSSFLGFTNLQNLTVPLELQCPGGSSAWQEVTERGSSRLCHGQRNPCNSSGELGTWVTGTGLPEHPVSLCPPSGALHTVGWGTTSALLLGLPNPLALLGPGVPSAWWGCAGSSPGLAPSPPAVPPQPGCAPRTPPVPRTAPASPSASAPAPSTATSACARWVPRGGRGTGPPRRTARWGGQSHLPPCLLAGRLPRPALLQHPGGRDGRPVPAAVGHPAPESQGPVTGTPPACSAPGGHNKASGTAPGGSFLRHRGDLGGAVRRPPQRGGPTGLRRGWQRSRAAAAPGRAGAEREGRGYANQGDAGGGAPEGGSVSMQIRGACP